MRGVKSFNMPAFNAADDALQAAGHKTFNPARVDEAHGFDLMICDGTEDLTSLGFNLRNVLGADLAWLTKHADGVAYLSGSFGSKGAMAEMATARALSLPVEKVDYWITESYRPAGWNAEAEAGYLAWAAKEDAAYVESQTSPESHVPVPVSLIEWDAKIPESITEEVRAEDRKYRAWTAAENAAYVESQAGPGQTYVHYDREMLVGKPPPVDYGDEERVTSATGGQKGRKLAELGGIDPQALLTLAEISGMGARKYAVYNYLNGYSWSLSFNAMQRHMLTFWAGQDNDDESGLPHVAHAAWHCLALLAFLQRDIGTDDRFKQEGV
jgi:Domain of unknown function (DUF5664)/Domain of unknown function (DUF4406)